MLLLRGSPRQRKPRPKPARFIKWLTSPMTHHRPYAAIRIRCGKSICAYYLSEFACIDGQGFQLERIDLHFAAEDRARYHVFFHDNGNDHSCDCMGFERWRHCKHVDGLRALLSQPTRPAAEAMPKAA